MAVRKKGLYLELNFFNVIVYPVAQTIAMNSRKFPSMGFGASSVAVLNPLKITAPVIAVTKPIHVRDVVFSLRTKKAAIATS